MSKKKKKKSYKSTSNKKPASQKVKKQEPMESAEEFEEGADAKEGAATSDRDVDFVSQKDESVEPAEEGAEKKKKEKKEWVPKNPVSKFLYKFRTDPMNFMWKQPYTPSIDTPNHGAQMLPIVLFAAITITLVRMYQYTRDMEQFFWSDGENDLIEFFSHFKLVAIIIAVALAVLIIVYRMITQSFGLKRVSYYIPMAIYALFVLLSYIFSKNKEFALIGWNDRFEGTITLLCYIIMLFFIINFVSSERNVKWVIYPVAATTFVLSVIGVTQALDHDFFRTAIGQKLIVPNGVTDSGDTVWELIDEAAAQGEQLLGFTFQHQEIYQTVYNINYVSFYLTLLIPLFGLLFIREKNWIKKTVWGILFALLVFNLIGSASSSGLMGMGVIAVITLILFNKRILQWWRSVVLILIIVVAIGGFTADRWVPEFTGAAKSVLGITAEESDADADSDTETDATDDTTDTDADTDNDTTSDALGTSSTITGSNITIDDSTSMEGVTVGTDGSVSNAQTAATSTDEPGKYRFDYIDTDGMDIHFSLEGVEATITMNDGARATEEPFTIKDADGNEIDLGTPDSEGYYKIDSDGLDILSLRASEGESDGLAYCVMEVEDDELQWPFAVTNGAVVYRNQLGNYVDLENVPHWGFEDNLNFGSGRGYIWSRTFPMLADTLFIGYGADTYALAFPHNDYVGKHNMGWGLNMVVDKPHNMYLGIGVGTGVLSLITLLIMWGMYIVSSFRLYWREKYDTFIAYAGAGIFLGICGFLVSALVNDSSVSVMPLFYGMLGTGIAINMMIKRQRILEANPRMRNEDNRGKRSKKKGR